MDSCHEYYEHIFLEESTVKNIAIIRRMIDIIPSISHLFRSAEPAFRHNVVLTKWEQHYEAHPNDVTRRSQRSTLNYLRQAD